MICLSFRYFHLTEIYIQIWNKNDKLLADVLRGWLFKGWKQNDIRTGLKWYRLWNTGNKSLKRWLTENLGGFFLDIKSHLFESRNGNKFGVDVSNVPWTHREAAGPVR